MPLSSVTKKNRILLNIDEKEEDDHEDTHRNTSDSSITQKKTEPKLSSFITSVPKPKNAKVFTLNPYSPRRHSIYYVSESIRAINEKNSLALEHINASIRIIKSC